MPTIWLSTLGNDANTGVDYANAVLTLEQAYALSSVGDTINVVNDGDHTMTDPLSAWDIRHIGSDYTTTPGLRVRGTDSAGNPAMATFKADATNRIVCEVDDLSDYIWFEGLKMDYTALYGGATSGMNGIEFSGHPRNFRIWDCECWFTSVIGSGVTIVNTNRPYLFAYTDSSTAPASDVTADVKNNVCVNAVMHQVAWTKLIYDYHHNVSIFDAVDAVGSGIQVAFSAGAFKTRGFYNNTLILRDYGSTTAQAVIDSSGDDTAVLDVHSNLIYVECGSAASSPGLLGAILDGNPGATATAPVGIGYDIIALGPYISAFYSGWTTPDVGISSEQFNYEYRNSGSPAGTDVDPTSTLLQSQALTDVFNDTAVTYDWTPNSYTHTLPFDMRPLVGEFDAMDGGTVGALPFKSDPVDPGGGGGDGEDVHNYIDAAPFYRTIRKSNSVAAVRIRRNKVRNHVDFRHYLDDHIYSESTHRRTIVGAGDTVTLTFGGVDKGTLTMFSTDGDVTAVVTYYNGTANDTFTVVVGELLLIDQCQTRSVELTNSGSTDATVELVVFD